MEEELDYIENDLFDEKAAYVPNLENGKKIIDECSEIIKESNGQTYKIIYMDKFHNIVPKEKADRVFKQKIEDIEIVDL